MNVEVFVLCDAATEWHGKLNILGAFDVLWSRQIPAVHPHCSIAIRLRFSEIEQGQHKVQIQVVDVDGNVVSPPIEGMVQIAIQSGMTTTANVVLNLQNLTLPNYGEYSIDLAVDDRQRATLPLYLIAPLEPAP
ncbi:MAG: hypothetical protein H0T73_08715 [Ardenticatenales bacterium]|nr:hypothetical protein [Ardenticatenales bacterium]